MSGAGAQTPSCPQKRSRARCVPGCSSPGLVRAQEPESCGRTGPPPGGRQLGAPSTAESPVARAEALVLPCRLQCTPLRRSQRPDMDLPVAQSGLLPSCRRCCWQPEISKSHVLCFMFQLVTGMGYTCLVAEGQPWHECPAVRKLLAQNESCDSSIRFSWSALYLNHRQAATSLEPQNFPEEGAARFRVTFTMRAT